MQIVSFPEAEVPLELRSQARLVRNQVWPDLEGAGTGPIHDPALCPVSMLLLTGGRVVSTLDVLSKEITHGGHRYGASGLSTVATDQAHRGKGYARALVEAGRDAVAASGADLGIFTCDLPLQRFYECAGWEALPGTVLVGGTREAPFPSDQFEKVTMARFFSPLAREAAETFVGARIALYPGEIDKLW